MEVPIIDISSLLETHSHASTSSPATAPPDGILQEVIHVLSSLGFLYITGHGIPLELMTRMAQQNQLFSSLSDLEKQQFVSQKDKARRGYSSIASENFGSLAGEKKPNDLVEKLRFGPEILNSESDPYYLSNECKVHFAPNEWGHLPPSFRDTILEYSEAMQQLAIKILEILAMGLFESPSYFTSSMDHHTSILTLNHFPPLSSLSSPVQESQLRVAEHTDVSLITIVNQTQPSCSSDDKEEGSSSEGLEICTPNGHWIPIPNIPGTSRPTLPSPHLTSLGALVINIGDCLQFWSNNKLRSTRHRVSLPTEGNALTSGTDPLCLERYSIAYFVSPNYDTVMHQLQPQQCEEIEEDQTSSRPPLPLSLTYSEWRKGRIKEAMRALKRQR
jgi:isopenicillin N synthase-like dioxygenase